MALGFRQSYHLADSLLALSGAAATFQRYSGSA